MTAEDYYKENVKSTTADDKIFVGTVINIVYADETEKGENMVDIETENGIFGIWESEISKIEFAE